MPNLKGRGRIRISERKVNDGCEIIGGNLSLKEDHLSSIQHTETYSTAKKARIGHCNRIKEFIK